MMFSLMVGEFALETSHTVDRSVLTKSALLESVRRATERTPLGQFFLTEAQFRCNLAPTGDPRQTELPRRIGHFAAPRYPATCGVRDSSNL
jgi:hypothetical protein